MVNHSHAFKWLTSIKRTLSTAGRPDFFDLQNTVHCKSIAKIIKRTLIDQFKQKWHQDVQMSRKGRHYYTYKKDTDFENYLLLTPRNLSHYIFKFRTANHRFPIEVGRWHNIPYENRLCDKCNLNTLGDETHYLLRCQFFNNYRETFIDTKYTHTHNQFAFANLLQSQDIAELSKLGKFLRIILLSAPTDTN